jgi:hypothetical protein
MSGDWSLHQKNERITPQALFPVQCASGVIRQEIRTSSLTRKLTLTLMFVLRVVCPGVLYGFCFPCSHRTQRETARFGMKISSRMRAVPHYHSATTLGTFLGCVQ